MITVMISLKVDGHTRADVLEFEAPTPIELARVDEAILELRGHLERLARSMKVDAK